MITIVAGLVALSLSLNPQQPKLAFVSLAVIALFWLLDGYFLWREKQFIQVYDDVRQRDESAIDFNLSPTQLDKDEPSYFGALKAPALIPFYGGALVVPLLVLFGVFNG